MLEFSVTPSPLSITVFILFFAKIYHEYHVNKTSRAANEKHDKEVETRIKALEDEVNRMTEALDRTYAPKEYVHECFVSEKQFEKTIAHLSGTMERELKHLSNSIDSLTRLLSERNHD